MASLFNKNAKESQLDNIDEFLPLKESQSFVSVQLSQIKEKPSVELFKSGQL